MKLILGIFGVPAVGKSTLFRYVIKELGRGSLKKSGLLTYQLHPQTKTIVLGDYSKPGFGGTDRLSMAVQPVALGVMQAWAYDSNMKDWTVLFEGDRLFNSSFISSLEKILGLNCKWVMLEASDEVQKQRHKDRGDSQTEKWLKGRVTKCKRLQESLGSLTVLKNETPEDLKSNVDWILKTIGLEKV